MARYIDVENISTLFDEQFKKTRKLISRGEIHLDNLAEGFMEADRVIRKIPTADVEEVKHGEWEPYFLNNYQMGWTCSICGRHCGVEKQPYCHCGAKMDGKEDKKK